MNLACIAHNTVQVHRAALVQPPAPPMWSGKTKPTGVSLGNSTVVWNKAPEQAEASESGLFVASTQFDGNLHFQLGPTQKISFWIPFSYGFEEASFAAAPCLISRPDTGIFSAGLGAAFSTSLSERWYMGTSIETQFAMIPSHIRTYDDGRLVSDEEDQEIILVLRWSGVIGVDFDWVRIWGAVGLRNHPTNTKVQTEYAYSDHEGEVEMGPLYGMAGVGVEFDLGSYVSIMAQAYQPFPLYDHDLIYGPIVGLTLDLHSPKS